MTKSILSVLAIVVCLASQATAQTASGDSTYSIGNTVLVNTRSINMNIYPYVFYSPEIDLAFGGGGIITFYTGKEQFIRPSKIGLGGHYSTSNQYKIALSPQVYLLQNRVFLSLRLFLSDEVFLTPDVDNPEVEAKIYGTRFEIQVPALLSHKAMRKLALILDYMHVEPQDAAPDPGEDRPHTLGLGAGWVWDTRDRIFSPARGGMLRLQLVHFSEDLGSSFDFDRFEADLRRYFGLNAEKEQVLALQLFADMAKGSPPFYRVPALGGSNIMRGYKSGELRDMYYLAGQAEFRTHLWRRFGAVAFVGAGDVSHELDRFSLNDLKMSYGVGLRYTFNQKENVNLRADFGLGEDSNGVYFGVEEAF